MSQCSSDDYDSDVFLRLFEARRYFALNASFASVLLGDCSSNQAVFNGRGTTSDGLKLINSELGVGHGFGCYVS